MRRLFLSVGSLLLLATALLAFDTRPEPVSADGTRAAIDIPAPQHMTNTGGSDGAGLCVYTSVTVAARWHNLPELFSFRKFAESRPGGSWPEKLDADLKTYASRNGITLPPYVQHTGGDESFLDLCAATRRCAGITYAGLDGWYDSGIAHMVDLAHLDAKAGAIIDNNRAGKWVWGTRQQIVNRWKGLDDQGKDILVPSGRRWSAVGGGWAFVWLGPPAPPRPPSAAEAIEPTTSTPGPVRVWERTPIEGELGTDAIVYWMLYEDGVLAWVVDDQTKWHKAAGPDSWEEAASDRPAGVNAPNEPEPAAGWNQGVQSDKVGRVHRYWINGVECSRAKAFAAVAAPYGAGLVDDSDKYHLSVVGDRKATLALFAVGGPLEKYGRRLHVQVYAATDWPAKDRLATAVTLQEPAKIGGKVAGTAGTTDAVAIGRVLADVFDPPPAPPAPKPEPRPDPAPAPKPDPTPAPAPAPPAPAPKPGPAVPGWLQLILAGLLAWLATRKKG